MRRGLQLQAEQAFGLLLLRLALENERSLLPESMKNNSKARVNQPPKSTDTNASQARSVLSTDLRCSFMLHRFSVHSNRKRSE